MGVATLTQGGRTLRLRVDPTDISWDYKLNTSITETYGGRVVQILSVGLGDLSIAAQSGSGRWDYLYSVATFCRDVMFQQKETGEPAVFSFPPRNWVLKVFISSVDISDSVENVDYPFTISCKIQEDVTGVVSGSTLGSELDKIREDIGYERNDYNYPPDMADPDDVDPGGTVYDISKSDLAKTLDIIKKVESGVGSLNRLLDVLQRAGF